VIDTRTRSTPGPDQLPLRAITWGDLPGEREAWDMLICFRFALTLAHGLRGAGFVDWPAR